MIKSKVVEPHTDKQLLTYPIIMRNTTTALGEEWIVLFTERYYSILLVKEESIVGEDSSEFDAHSEDWEVFTGTVALCNDRS